MNTVHRILVSAGVRTLIVLTANLSVYFFVFVLFILFVRSACISEIKIKHDRKTNRRTCSKPTLPFGRV